MPAGAGCGSARLPRDMPHPRGLVKRGNRMVSDPAFRLWWVIPAPQRSGEAKKR